ncbi:MFS transporter [Acetobacteraceae bacterium H6797]|nr:MFS transporter [Acetobacteraceae bacterium H6797]
MTVTTADAELATAKRNVWLLFLCQALMSAAVVGQVAMSALIGHSLAGNKALATLPMALQMTATMAASIPAGIIFPRFGRRAGFFMGAVASLLGSLIFAAGVWQADFTLYCIGALPAGLGFGISQHYRFAASEVAPPSYRPRAIALVMAGGVLAAIFGPELVKNSKDLFAPFLFLGTYLALACLPVICMLILTVVGLPPAPPRPKVAVPMREIMRRPAFLTAAITAAAAYGTMNLVMTSTPIEMMLCGFDVADSSTVIQLHAIAMFAPGFFMGRLIARYGARRVIKAGIAANILCVIVALAGEQFTHFSLALILLGLGWNAMFTGATSLLAESHTSEERVKAQAANDLIVFGTVGLSAFGSGAIHALGGWAALTLVLVPAMAVAGWMIMRPARAFQPA